MSSLDDRIKEAFEQAEADVDANVQSVIVLVGEIGAVKATLVRQPAMLHLSQDVPEEALADENVRNSLLQAEETFRAAKAAVLASYQQTQQQAKATPAPAQPPPARVEGTDADEVVLTPMDVCEVNPEEFEALVTCHVRKQEEGEPNDDYANRKEKRRRELSARFRVKGTGPGRLKCKTRP